jgi:NADH:ubiquinone oxidoreductase subunit F (NADH-binding)
LIEVPIGMTIREVVYDVAGGIKDGKGFKAVQIGGPMGGCLSSDHLDLPIDYESLTAAGAMMGSGGLVVLDDETCMVDIARYFMDFTQDESCGKCTPCRAAHLQWRRPGWRYRAAGNAEQANHSNQPVRPGTGCA